MLTEEEFSRYQRILSVRRNSNKVFERWQYLPWLVTVILTSFSFAFTVYMVSMHPTRLDNLCNICFQRCKSFLPVVFSLACCGRHWNFYSLMKFNGFFFCYFCAAMESRVMTRWGMQKYARAAYDIGIRYIGGCCGFEPYHIRALAEEVRLYAT